MSSSLASVELPPILWDGLQFAFDAASLRGLAVAMVKAGSATAFELQVPGADALADDAWAEPAYDFFCATGPKTADAADLEPQAAAPVEPIAPAGLFMPHADGLLLA
jgi:hypothetical protein